MGEIIAVQSYKQPIIVAANMCFAHFKCLAQSVNLQFDCFAAGGKDYTAYKTLQTPLLQSQLKFFYSYIRFLAGERLNGDGFSVLFFLKSRFVAIFSLVKTAIFENRNYFFENF
jgi:hypothetical protein